MAADCCCRGESGSSSCSQSWWRSRFSSRASAATCLRSARTSEPRGCAACASSGARSRCMRLRARFAGLAGVMEFSRLSVGDPTVAIGAELGVIAAVIIGGGSLSGGKGTVVGTIAGAGIMTRHPDRLLAARAAELGAGNRDRHDHCVCRRARSSQVQRLR